MDISLHVFKMYTSMVFKMKIYVITIYKFKIFFIFVQIYFIWYSLWFFYFHVFYLWNGNLKSSICRSWLTMNPIRKFVFIWNFCCCSFFCVDGLSVEHVTIILLHLQLIDKSIFCIWLAFVHSLVYQILVFNESKLFKECFIYNELFFLLFY